MITHLNYRSETAKLLLLTAVDLAVYFTALGAGVPWFDAHFISFISATVLVSIADALLQREKPRSDGGSPTWAGVILVALCALFLRGGLLALLVDILRASPQSAIFWGAALSSTVVFWGDFLRELPDEDNSQPPAARRTRWTAWSLIIYIVLLRLVYSSPFELLHEEGYYWLYAQFIDIGYLDHPPMVGWLIWAFTSALGQSEFVIRIGAFLCWLITAAYMYRLTDAVGGRTAALHALLLTAILPVFFALGMLMIPDAPLVACWAGALYYLYRVIVEERTGAWLGVGICMGLGLLSKYTMVLLGGAAVVFIAADPHSRKWLKRPEPYLAAGLAILIFSPVIVWNARHDWVSFYFQSIGRHKTDFNFGLPDLIGSSLVLLTPAGVLTAIAVWASRKQVRPQITALKGQQALRLLTTLTLLPLAVFFAFSLFRMSKLNWSGAIWLGVMPYLAMFANPLGKAEAEGREGLFFFPRLWPATTGAVVVLYGCFLHYMALGLPGVPYPHNLLDIGKRELAAEISTVRNAYAQESGETPLVICWQAERLAGWLSYYLARSRQAPQKGAATDAVRNTTGPHLFGDNSRMFSYWHPPDTFDKRKFIFVGPGRGPLNYLRVRAKAAPVGDIEEIIVRKNGKMTGRYFYRFFNMKPEQLAAGLATLSK